MTVRGPLGRRAVLAAGVTLVTAMTVIGTLVMGGGSRGSAGSTPAGYGPSGPLPDRRPAGGPIGPGLGPEPTKGTRTFHLTWPDRVNVPPPVGGWVRLADGRPVGFAYGGAKTNAGRQLAEIGLDVGLARRRWIALSPGQSRSLETVVVKLVRINRADDSADVEVTVR